MLDALLQRIASNRMPVRLGKRLRCRAALALAALYAFCILFPGVALALGGGAAAHCLTEAAPAHVHKAVAEITHEHGDGATHSHATEHRHADAGAPHHEGGAQQEPPGTCCGLFCISAIAHEPLGVAASTAIGMRTIPSPDFALAGRGPFRINRPPIR
jgi:hypothetical protein